MLFRKEIIQNGACGGITEVLVTRRLWGEMSFFGEWNNLLREVIGNNLTDSLKGRLGKTLKKIQGRDKQPDSLPRRGIATRAAASPSIIPAILSSRLLCDQGLTFFFINMTEFV